MITLKEAAEIACKLNWNAEIQDIGRILELPESYFFMFCGPDGGMVDVNKQTGKTYYTYIPPFALGKKVKDIPFTELFDE